MTRVNKNNFPLSGTANYIKNNGLQIAGSAVRQVVLMSSAVYLVSRALSEVGGYGVCLTPAELAIRAGVAFTVKSVAKQLWNQKEIPKSMSEETRAEFFKSRVWELLGVVAGILLTQLAKVTALKVAAVVVNTSHLAACPPLALATGALFLALAV